MFLTEKLWGDENFPTLMSVLRFFFVILRGNFIGMTITELQQQYAAHPNMAVMKRLLKDTSVQTVFAEDCVHLLLLFFLLYWYKRVVVRLSLF